MEIKTGPRAGELIVVKEGESVTVGRTTNAKFALPQDTFLSRVHFAVECSGSMCRLIDHQSANGTLLNDVKVGRPAELREGDMIMAGQTNFIVHLVAAPSSAPSSGPPVPSGPSGPPRLVPPPTAEPITDRPKPIQSSPASQPASAAPPDTVVIGSWFFGIIPEGWQVVEGFGLRRRERNAFLSEAMVSESALAPGQTFDQYVESQLELVRLLVSQAQIQPDITGGPPAIRGAEEVKAFAVRYKMDDGRRFLQRQIYVRSGQSAGALAATTLESDAPAVQPFFDQIFRGLAFRGL
ncbi:MAG: FHA domain-containing protein [Terriglobia bacterium]